jgi:N-acetylglutamate synthase-like GNAT family acetyltransferase
MSANATIRKGTYTIRASTLDDASSVSEILAASYATLLAAHYAPDVLERALPFMNTANPKLLGCGTYYVAEIAQGVLIGCGGWTHEPPGARDVVPGEGHVRHFGTHPDWARQGVARSIMDRCRAEARLQGVTRLHCHATLQAENFYKALGFTTIGPLQVRLRNEVELPSIKMLCDLRVP